MPRGRQYYDPEIQMPSKVPGEPDLARIEFYPDQDGRWIGRRIDHDGRVVGYTSGNIDHDAELAHAQELWPGLTVYELPDERADSTWEGVGPSPRIWQNSSPETGAPTPPAASVPSSGPSTDAATSVAGDEQFLIPVVEPAEDQVALHLFPIPERTKPGIYVRLDDMRVLLESWAVAYEVDKNPSAAMALRDAADALKDIG